MRPASTAPNALSDLNSITNHLYSIQTLVINSRSHSLALVDASLWCMVCESCSWHQISSQNRKSSWIMPQTCMIMLESYHILNLYTNNTPIWLGWSLGSLRPSTKTWKWVIDKGPISVSCRIPTLSPHISGSRDPIFLVKVSCKS